MQLPDLPDDMRWHVVTTYYGQGKQYDYLELQKIEVRRWLGNRWKTVGREVIVWHMFNGRQEDAVKHAAKMLVKDHLTEDKSHREILIKEVNREL